MLAEKNALLDYYKSCGVDFLCADEEAALLAKSPTQPVEPESRNLAEPQAAFTASNSPANPAILMSGEAQILIQKAEDLCQNTANLQELSTNLAKFEAPAYAKNAKNCLFFDETAQNNDKTGQILVIKDMPYSDEERSGEFLKGQEGDLLKKMLAAIGLQEGDFTIANTVFWRTPGQRNLKSSEIECCRPFVKKLVEFIQPKAVLVLGTPPSYSLLGLKEPIAKIRGKWFEEFNTKIMPTFSVQALLNNVSLKKAAWEDLQNFQKIIAN